jgi:hypothetical protein
LLLLPPRGQAAYPRAIPARPSAQCPTAWARAFFLASRMEEAHRSTRCPRVAALVHGAAPPTKTTAPVSWRLTLPWVSPGAGWWVTAGRGHRKGQLRVLGSPSALHTKEPRTGWPPGGRGVHGPDFVLRTPLDTYLVSYIPGGAKYQNRAASEHPPRAWPCLAQGQSVQSGGILATIATASSQQPHCYPAVGSWQLGFPAAPSPPPASRLPGAVLGGGSCPRTPRRGTKARWLARDQRTNNGN